MVLIAVKVLAAKWPEKGPLLAWTVNHSYRRLGSIYSTERMRRGPAESGGVVGPVGQVGLLRALATPLADALHSQMVKCMLALQETPPPPAGGVDPETLV